MTNVQALLAESVMKEKGSRVSVRERPILMRGEMVRAILEGRKTQTRRILKQDLSEFEEPVFGYGIDGHAGPGMYVSESEYPEEGSRKLNCFYGNRGDRLWVRETWGVGRQCKDGPEIWYRATENRTSPRWKPSIHMPRWASRIMLEITDIRVERLQDITEADAIAEGMIQGSAGWSETKERADNAGDFLGTPKMAFANYINRLHGGKLWNLYYNSPSTRKIPIWEQNPYVWVIDFRKI